MINNEVRNQEIHIMGLTHLPYEGCSVCDDKRAKGRANNATQRTSRAIAKGFTAGCNRWSTGENYCANCGSTGSCKRHRSTETLDQCSNHHPRPITLAWHQQEIRFAAIAALTTTEAQHTLDLFTYSNPDMIDNFLHLNGH